MREVRKIRILISQPLKLSNDNDKIIAKVMLGVLGIVKAWKEEGMIIGAVNSKNKILNKKDAVLKWVHKPKMIGSTKLYFQICFNIVTICSIRLIVLN